jgi:quinoprotein glucose dehydrogenase
MKPPYGRITAYDMNRGEIAWQIPNGDTPPAIKNNPALQ